MTSINPTSESIRDHHCKRALWWYVASLLVICFGFFMAAKYYPGGFDWFYTVASALASQKHNPTGSVWFAGGLSLSMLLLWLYVSSIKTGLSALLPSAGFAITAIRFGLICGFLLGAERLLIYDLSYRIDKAHEGLALFTLLGLYVGVIGLLLQFMHRKKSSIFPVLLILSPLVAIGIGALLLYLEQRDVGWVDTNWREKGIPIWLSFAFWQWLAIGLLWTGLGLLYVFSRKKQEQ
jgi:hypothetical protein